MATVTFNPIGINEITGDLTSEEKYYALKRYSLDFVEDCDNLSVTAFFTLELLQKMEEDKEAIPRHGHDLKFP